MHEFSVMNSVVETILQKIKDYPYKKVEKVNLVIGELTFLAPEQLKFAFSILTENTPLEGAELNIKIKKAKIKCLECGYEGTLKVEEDPVYHFTLPIFKCPKCKGKIEVIEGKECEIKNVEVKEWKNSN